MQNPTFSFDRPVEYTHESVLRELQRVAAVVHPAALTTTSFKKLGRVGISTVRRHYGTWRQALAAAGVGHDLDAQKPLTPKMTQQHAKSMTDEQLLDLLRAVSSAVGGESLSQAVFNRLAPISAITVSRRFHGWRAAIELAGLDSTRVPRRYSDEECFANLLNVWTFRGQAPRVEDMAQPPSRISSWPYVARWRTWRRALKAFADHVNSDTAATTPGIEVAQSSPASLNTSRGTSTRRPSAGEQRSLSIGLRYRILKRDRFRCVLCGRSPAGTPGLELHVDHILAFSQGGKSVADNLRSTCRDCNLGKGVHT